MFAISAQYTIYFLRTTFIVKTSTSIETQKNVLYFKDIPEGCLKYIINDNILKQRNN